MRFKLSQVYLSVPHVKAIHLGRGPSLGHEAPGNVQHTGVQITNLLE